jgi:hypothetical protein
MLTYISSLKSGVETRDAYIKLHEWISEGVRPGANKVRKLAITIGP